jgi:predicted Zn-dependent protease
MGGRYGNGGGGGRFLIALVVAVISLIGYFGSRQKNPITGETQHVGGISTKDEIALGLQAAPELAQQFGGRSSNRAGQAKVSEVGERLVRQTKAAQSPYQFDFHLLDDDRTINAFALPGGQVFITDALFNKIRSEGQLAGVLGHEIGHVIGRHGAEHLAKQKLLAGLGGAAVIASTDPNDPGGSRQRQMVAMAVTQLVNLKFGRNDELESDRLGVRLMGEAGYDPNSMIGVMEILRDSAKGGRQPEFFATHPNPENRITRIKEAIKEEFPNGLPSGLQK